MTVELLLMSTATGRRSGSRIESDRRKESGSRNDDAHGSGSGSYPSLIMGVNYALV